MNTASRMESTGEPLRLQTTEASNSLMNAFHQSSGIAIECRGIRNVKGKGGVMTYWGNHLMKQQKIAFTVHPLVELALIQSQVSQDSYHFFASLSACRPHSSS